MQNLSGTTIKGYEIRNQVGAGGFGAVFRAYQSVIEREVAIKVILPQHANQPEFIRGFESEAQLIARLEHPYIVPLYDYWRDPEGAFLVMRFLKGGSLARRLNAGSLSISKTVQMIDQIASALYTAHRNGVVHRDLKPDNILLDEEENAFLTDFGIAKLVGRDASSDNISGSLRYMAPEQLRAEPTSVSADVYSLSLMIFEMLTGRYPFGELTPTALVMKHLAEPIPNVCDFVPELPARVNEILQRASAKEPDARYTDVREIARDLRAAIERTNAPAITLIDVATIQNPYKGLRAFQEADAADFFGRDVLLAQLIEQLALPHPYQRFLSVVGPSGSGKSSVVRAGVVPALRNGIIPGSEKWFIVDMVPGEQPLRQLEAALLSVALRPPARLYEMLRADEDSLLWAVDRVLADVDGDLMLIIDQFEELFTNVESEEERVHFLTLLKKGITSPESRLRIVITLRADFTDRPLEYVDFGELMRERTEFVLPLSSYEIERSIAGPAERVGLVVEPSLVAAILSDVREEPGALPLLQYALTEVFERREGNRLTLAGYRSSGGVLGALARRAEEVFVALSEPQQRVARQMFLRLVALGEGTEDTRRRARRSEIADVVQDNPSLQSILDRYGQYRLLTFDFEPGTREPTLEVAHEALIREWQRLRGWLDNSRADVRLQRVLAGEAAEWENNQRDASFLLSGARLTNYEEWSAATDLALTQREHAYIDASIEERRLRNVAEDERKKREEDTARRADLFAKRATQLRRAATALGVIGVMAGIAVVVAITQVSSTQTQVSAGQTQIAGVEPTLNAAQAEVMDAERQIAGAQTQVAGVQPTLDSAQSEIDSAQTQISGVQPTLEAGQTQVAGVEPTLLEADARVAAGQTQIAGVQPTVDAAQAQIDAIVPTLELAQTQVAGVEPTVRAADARVGAAETQVAAVQPTVQAARLQLDSAQTQIAGVQPTLESGQTQVAGVQPTLDAADVRVGVAETQVAAVQPTVAAAQAQIDAIQPTLQFAQTQVAGVEPTLAAADARVGVAETQVAGVQPTVIAAQAQLDSAQTQISGVQPTLEAGQTQVAGVQPTLDAADARVAEGQTQVAGVQPTVAAAQAQIDAIVPTLEAGQTQVAGVRPTLLVADARVAEAQTQVAGVQPTLDAAQAQIAAIVPTLAGAQTQVAGVQPTLDAADTQVAGVEPTLAAAESRVAGVQPTLESAETQIAGVAPTLAFVQQEVNAQRDIADALRLVRSAQTLLEAGNTDLAIALVLEAYRLNPTIGETQRILNSAIPLTVRLNILGSIGSTYWSTQQQNVTVDAVTENEIVEPDYFITTDRSGFQMFTPDERFLLVANRSGSVDVWSPATRSLIVSMAVPGSITTMTISPDGLRTVVGTSTGTIYVYDTGTGGLIFTLVGHTGAVLALDYSPLEQKLISGSDDRSAIVWDLTNGTLAQQNSGHSGPVLFVTFNANGTEAYAYDFDQDNPRISVFRNGVAPGFRTLGIRYRAISPNGEIGITGGQPVQFVAVYDADSGVQQRTFQRGNNSEDWVRNFAFSHDNRSVLVHLEVRNYNPDRTYVVTGRRVEQWSAVTGELLGTFDFRQADATNWDVYSLAYSPDDQRVLMGVRINRTDSVLLWDVNTFSLLRQFKGHTSSVVQVGFSANETYAFSTGADGNVRLWDIGTRDKNILSRITPREDSLDAIGVNADGSQVMLAFNQQSATNYDVATGEEIRTRRFFTSAQYLVKFSQGKPLALVNSADGLILWDLTNSTRAHTFVNVNPEAVTALAFSPDGNRLFYTESQTTYLYDIATDTTTPLFQANTSYLAVSPNGEYVARADNLQLSVWDIVYSEWVFNANVTNGNLTSLAYSPDGGRLITALGEPDNTAIIWDIASQSRVYTLVGHQAEVTDAVFSPDGVFALTGSQDTTLILWDAQTGQIIRQYLGHTAPVRQIVFSPLGGIAYSYSDSVADGIIGWAVESVQQTVNWVYNNRYIQDIDCPTRLQYGVKPICVGNVIPPPLPTPTTQATATQTATPTPRPTLTPTPTPIPLGRVETQDGSDGLLREGAGSGFAVITRVPVGTIVQILSVQADIGWLNVRLPDGTVGWISQAVVRGN